MQERNPWSIYCISVVFKSTSLFWKESISLIAVDANIVLNASHLDILLGEFDLEKDFLLVNHIFSF